MKLLGSYKSLWLIAIAASCWSIWLAKNEMVFENKVLSMDTLIFHSNMRALLRVRAAFDECRIEEKLWWFCPYKCNFPKSVSRGWCYPPHGWLKFNVSGIDSESALGGRGVMRDEESIVRALFSGPSDTCDAETAELGTIITALDVFIETVVVLLPLCPSAFASSPHLCSLALPPNPSLVILSSLPSLKRCGKSCRWRWMNYLWPGLKRGNFTEEEDALITKLHEQFGNRWSTLAKSLRGRTDNEIKNHWHSRLKKSTKGDEEEKCSSWQSEATQNENICEGEAESNSIDNMTLGSSPTSSPSPSSSSGSMSSLSAVGRREDTRLPYLEYMKLKAVEISGVSPLLQTIHHPWKRVAFSCHCLTTTCIMTILLICFVDCGHKIAFCPFDADTMY
ncbi:hypothetical protein CXB51_035460 [Gossypium anomalum]|uniref:Uncharacterized protein n=1 Tax=Gossypium anomalum TaxID=47600 RepID=A0A8J6CJM7_9ROSI|nr:hypothetical protein CXB51_035460 [Gossypium anomalum]